MKKTHYILYITAGIWNLTVCWPIVLLVRLFWGENLRWEQNPDPDVKDGKSLWCDLKPGSWPTRSWYAKYESKSWLAWLTKEEPIKNPPAETVVPALGPYRTWGGTTLGHGGFYGPGAAKHDGWTRIMEHEHVHVEQFEGAMVRGFFEALIVVIALLAFGESRAALWLGLFLWWFGYLWMGISNWLTATLRGESPYRGSSHEESARALEGNWQDAAGHLGDKES